MRIFLAGATGVIGRRLLPVLLERGHEVTALTRQPDEVARLRALGAATVLGDVLDRDAVLRAVRSAVPEVVMHQLTDLRDQDQPGDVPATESTPLDLAASGRRLATVPGVSSFVHVDDAAQAAAAALDWPPGAVNVCDDRPAAGREWVPAFCRAVGAPATPVPAREAERNRWARGASNAYARKDLSWRPAYPSWRAGFATL
jgi:nucleoside-diphosphate-sugar epimerase